MFCSFVHCLWLLFTKLELFAILSATKNSLSIPGLEWQETSGQDSSSPCLQGFREAEILGIGWNVKSRPCQKMDQWQLQEWLSYSVLSHSFPFFFSAAQKNILFLRSHSCCEVIEHRVGSKSTMEAKSHPLTTLSNMVRFIV
jgi:hypothetical protein